MLSNPVAGRVEVFTGTGRRRRWSAEAKARIVAETYATSVGEVADRYGVAKTQLFTWRRELRQPLPAVGPVPLFTPVIMGPTSPVPRPSSSSECKPEPKAKKARRVLRGGGIELEIDGVVVRVERGAEASTVAAVIQALKAGR